MWRRNNLVQIVLVAASLGRSVTDAFAVVRPAASLTTSPVRQPTSSFHDRRMAATDDDPEKGPEIEEKEASGARKPRRRKRKVQVAVVEEEAVVEAAVELKPRRSEAAVAFSVTDVRTLVGGASPAANLSEAAAPTGSAKEVATTTTMATRSPVSTGGATTSSDSLEQLLQDAKDMQALEDTREDKGDSAESSITATIRNVISTIVTVDFFVVCTFLLWFLAGVFSSYVLKNDAVQIAFNSNFQLLVQPALGILMIGSLAGAVFEEKDDEGETY